MSGEEEFHRITPKGIDVALGILGREGLLPQPTNSLGVDVENIKAACDRYLEAFRAGSNHTEQEALDAIVIAYFDAYLEDMVRGLAN